MKEEIESLYGYLEVLDRLVGSGDLSAVVERFRVLEELEMLHVMLQQESTEG